MSTTNKNQIDVDGVAEMGKRFTDAWNRAAIDTQMVTPNTVPPPTWLKDVQELSSSEIDQIEAVLRAGALTEAQA